MRNRRMNLQLLKFALALSLVSGQAQQTLLKPLEAAEPAPPSTPQSYVPLPLQSNDQNANSLPNEEQSTKRPPLFKLLLERLEERKQNNNNTVQMIPDRLTLTLQDAADNTVSIELLPSTGPLAQEEVWSDLVNLLVNNLVDVIQAAEQQGYNANFKYSISLTDMSGLEYVSANALKSAAG